MGVKNRYFLIARESKTNDYQVIPVDNQYGTSLEKIDLYTMSFEDSNTLTNFLNKVEHLNMSDVDYFIVHQRKVNGKRHLYYQEVLYKEPSVVVRDVAKASLEGDLSKERLNILGFINGFCRKMQHDQRFYDMIMYGYSPLYWKFRNYFSDKRFQDTYHIKYKDGGWIMDSYTVFRNIVQSYMAYKYGYVDKRDERKVIEEDLYRITEKDYNPDQFSLFDIVGDSDGYQKTKGRRESN